MFYDGYTYVGEEKIVGKAPGRNRIQDGGFTNMLIIMRLQEGINTVLVMVITGLERSVLQTFENEKRMFLTMVVLKNDVF